MMMRRELAHAFNTNERKKLRRYILLHSLGGTLNGYLKGFLRIFIPQERYIIGSSSTPPSWVTIEDNFFVFTVMNTSHLSPDLYAAPHAHFGDGCVDMVFQRYDSATRLGCLSALLSASRGTFSSRPGVSYHKVRAFTLEPLSNHAMGIDGERIPVEPLQCFVIPHLLRLFG
ncbi:hypothetical protein Pelo_10612 [Pelomyxa schiedti]|nr:hypothetical protein Pelo_10612 [Pelomyxa schiedti]